MPTDNPPPNQPSHEKRDFLGVFFVRCNAYGRLYKDKQGKFYAGFCPKCSKPIRIRIDKTHGINQRFFEVFC